MCCPRTSSPKPSVCDCWCGSRTSEDSYRRCGSRCLWRLTRRPAALLAAFCHENPLASVSTWCIQAQSMQGLVNTRFGLQTRNSSCSLDTVASVSTWCIHPPFDEPRLGKGNPRKPLYLQGCKLEAGVRIELTIGVLQSLNRCSPLFANV